MENSQSIKGILNTLAKDNPHITWRLGTPYANGMGSCLREAIIYKKPFKRIIGRVLYEKESGKVIRYRYPGYRMQGSLQILDFLLDILNLERKGTKTLSENRPDFMA